MVKFTACVAFCALVSIAVGLNHNEKATLRASGFVNSLQFQYRLRVCNAYPSNSGIDVFHGKRKSMTEAPIDYKSCADFATPLVAGDKLEFKLGNSLAGTFSISDLPNNDAILLLIIHRHDTLTNAVAFESHVFANLLNAQVAIVDTYKGTARASMSIRDQAIMKTNRVEPLKYDSVVAVNSGKYEVVLTDAEGKEQAETGLIALNRQSYVVLRVGVESQQGPSYPEELMVYPINTFKQLVEQEAAEAEFGSAQSSMKLSLALLIAAIMCQWSQ